MLAFYKNMFSAANSGTNGFPLLFRRDAPTLHPVIHLLTLFNDMEEKYLIISGTDRPGSNTLKVAEQYQELFREQGIEAQLLSLESYNPFETTDIEKKWQEEWLIPAAKFIFISPEYNGSIPGILKLLIDRVDIRRVWWYKKAMLAGVSIGRAGNLRGMDHLTGILHYLKVHVLPNKLPLSSVDRFLNGEGRITDEATLRAMKTQVEEFIKY